MAGTESLEPRAWILRPEARGLDPEARGPGLEASGPLANEFENYWPKPL